MNERKDVGQLFSSHHGTLLIPACSAGLMTAGAGSCEQHKNMVKLWSEHSVLFSQPFLVYSQHQSICVYFLNLKL